MLASAMKQLLGASEYNTAIEPESCDSIGGRVLLHHLFIYFSRELFPFLDEYKGKGDR